MKIASDLPALIVSSGKAAILFAVAMTNTGDVFPWSQVSKWENMPEVVPVSVSPELLTPESAISSSSSQTTHSPNDDMRIVQI